MDTSLVRGMLQAYDGPTIDPATKRDNPSRRGGQKMDGRRHQPTTCRCWSEPRLIGVDCPAAEAGAGQQLGDYTFQTSRCANGSEPAGRPGPAMTAGRRPRG